MAGKNKTRLVGWHPSDPAAVTWLDAEIERRGGTRGAQSAILDQLLGAAMNDTATTAAGLRDRIRALDDTGRKSVLNYLSGYAPQALAAALDEIESQAVQVTEDSHGRDSM